MKPNANAPSTASLRRLMDTLGYHFQHEQLLRLALRHPSIGAENNQRLEFLGDAVLQLTISHRLYLQQPEQHEGAMTQMRQKLVCEQALADVARQLQLGDYMVMDHGSEISGVRLQDGPLSDAMEAVLAAVYLDGGFDSACALINRFWPDRATVSADAKSRLQEFLQARGQEAPAYEAIGETGPDHARLFTVRATLSDGRFAVGEGHSKKRAEQAAAAAMLSILEAKPSA